METQTPQEKEISPKDRRAQPHPEAASKHQDTDSTIKKLLDPAFRKFATDLIHTKDSFDDKDAVTRAKIRAMFRSTGEQAQRAIIGEALYAEAQKLIVRALRHELNDLEKPLFHPGETVSILKPGSEDEFVQAQVVDTMSKEGTVRVMFNDEKGARIITLSETELAQFNTISESEEDTEDEHKEIAA